MNIFKLLNSSVECGKVETLDLTATPSKSAQFNVNRPSVKVSTYSSFFIKYIC